jgi:hypothetical protein
MAQAALSPQQQQELRQRMMMQQQMMQQQQQQQHQNGQAGGPGQPGQQRIMIPPPDPNVQALIEADFKPVDLSLTAPNDTRVVCGPHSLEKCDSCYVDFMELNRLTRALTQTKFNVPPPPNIRDPNLVNIINRAKEEGNVHIYLLPIPMQN